MDCGIRKIDDSITNMKEIIIEILPTYYYGEKYYESFEFMGKFSVTFTWDENGEIILLT
jgi:hypothetical protein